MNYMDHVRDTTLRWCTAKRSRWETPLQARGNTVGKREGWGMEQGLTQAMAHEARVQCAPAPASGNSAARAAAHAAFALPDIHGRLHARTSQQGPTEMVHKEASS